MINVKCAHTYCKDDITKIENYDKAINDTTQTWHLHHRLELTLDGEFAHTKEDLIRMNMYCKRPYFELIFLTKYEHIRLHRTVQPCSADTRKKLSDASKGRTVSDETKLKMSEALKGRTSPNKGRTLSEEHRKKISEARKAYLRTRNQQV